MKKCEVCGTDLPEFRDQRLGFAPPGVTVDAAGFWTEVSHGYCPNGCKPDLKIKINQPD